MNKLRPTIKLALFISVAGAFLAACSDDDDKKPSAPSKIITGIRVYKITDVISYEGDLDFTYDKDKRLTGVRGNAPLTTINSVSYTHLRAHETLMNLVCRLLLEKKKNHSFICRVD